MRRTGEVVTAVYGLASTLLSVMQELKPTHVIVALDKGKDTFRHKISKEYKATRAAMPDDLRAQLDRCREVIEAFGFPIYEDEEYEADDLLGALSTQAAEQGVETYLVSLDSDIAQLVRPGVRLWMYRPYQRDSVVYESAEDVKGRYGVLPEQMPDLKALKGDVSDNIAGVPGVGDKTAARLVEEFGSVEGLYERIDEVTPPKLQARPQGARGAGAAGQAPRHHRPRGARPPRPRRRRAWRPTTTASACWSCSGSWSSAP